MKVIAGMMMVLALPVLVQAADWAQWHGPRRDNISTETGLMKQWPADGPKLLWKAAKLGHGYSTVSIADGLIYTSGIREKRVYVTALTMDGKVQWESPNGLPWEPSRANRWARSYGGARGTPTVDEGRVYQLNELGRLAAFDAKTGAEIWSLDIVKTFDADAPMWAYAESVLIDGDRLIVTPGGRKGHIVALDKKTGKLVWANTEIKGKASYSSPRLVEDQGVRQIINVNAAGLFAVNADTGKSLWAFAHTNKRRINCLTPIYSEGRVFNSNGYGGGSVQVQLTFDGQAVTAKEAWTSAAPDNHHGGVVLIDGYLYGSGDVQKGWACLDFKTGKTQYRVDGIGKGSVSVAGGMLYCMSERGTVALATPSPEGFKIVSRFELPKGGTGQYWAHPVICGGRLYLRHSETLFVYDIKAE